ncbi:MAG: sugar phosphate isomerase/epimerase family protein [Planctomycetota bacterium]
MRFGICNETFLDWPFDKAFAFAAACGYTGIEIAPFTLASDVRNISSASRNEVRRQAAAAGLEIIGLHWLLAKTEGFHLTSPVPSVRRTTAEYFAHLTRLCADLGGLIMVLGSPQQRSLPPDVTQQQAADFAVEVLSRTVLVLEQTGVQLVIEPLSPVETDFLTTAQQVVELIGRIGSPAVRLHLDCKATATEQESIPALIVRHHDVMVHFHANDPNRQGPGFGALDFVPIFQALCDVDYRGWVSVEVFDSTPGIERLARESIEYMRRCAAKQIGTILP